MRPLLALAALLGALLAPAATLAQASASPFTSAQRYDAMRRVTGTIAADPDGAGPHHHAAVRNTYDGAGRLIRVETGKLTSWQSQDINPEAWSGFTVFRTAETAYDIMGRKVREQLREGADGPVRALTQYSYDLMGRLECTAVRMNPTAFGALPSSACTPGTQGSDGPDRITRTVYDAAGQRLQQREGIGTADEGTEASWAHNLSGQVTTIIDGNGNRAELRYDGHGRQDRWTFPSAARAAAFNDATPATALASAGAVNATDYEQYGYDAAGNRVSLRKRDGSTLTYQYDALNRVIVKIVPERAGLAAAQTRDVHYAYDLLGHQIAARFDGPAGPGIANAYDGLGRLTATTNDTYGTPRTLAYQYDANGNRTRVTHPDGAFFTFRYEGLNRLERFYESGTRLIGIWQFTDTGLPLVLGRAGTGLWRSYDGVQRLSSLYHYVAYGIVTSTFAYNPAGQLASTTRDNDDYAWTGHYQVARPYQTNGLNQYSAAGGVSFGYDANGNLTAEGNRAYTYDVENRLVSTSNGAALAYDPLGRLHQVTGPGGGVTRFLYDGDALVAEYDAAGHVLRRYVHDAGADVPLFTYEGEDLTGIRQLFADRQGSITGIGDGAGYLLARNAYDEYGIPADSNQGRFQYTGQIWLPEIGMYHYKARVYSPYLGRFLQTDPLGYDDQLNLYAYVGNDPTNRTDPTGQFGVRARIGAAIWNGLPDHVKEKIATGIEIAGVIWDVATAPTGIGSGPEGIVTTQGISQGIRAGIRQGARQAPRTGARGGETAAAREGRRAHRVYGEHARRGDLRTGRDARLPSGREPDCIDDCNRIVRELKPDTPSGRASGRRQLERYVRELEEITGESWQGFLDLYTPFGRPR